MDKRDNLEESGGKNIGDIGGAPFMDSNSVEQKYENCEAISTGLKCDNPNCDWKDPTISFDGMEEYINKPCPKCGENLLTEADYKNAMTVKLTADFINSLSPEELVEISKSIDPNALINDPMFLGAEGLENIMNENATSLIINTHKELKVTHVKLNSTPNDERFVTQQAMPKDEEAGIKNSPSWEQILEKDFPLTGNYDADVEIIVKREGFYRAKDYYEKEVVEPLENQLDNFKTVAQNYNAREEQFAKEKRLLQQENERLKQRLEKYKNVENQ